MKHIITKLFFLLLPLPTLSYAQTILATVTGADGTTCRLTKQPSTTIYASFACTSKDGDALLRTAEVKSTSKATSYELFSQGNAPISFWWIGVNPTAAVATLPGIGSVPVNGITWNVAPGNGAAMVVGSVTWP